LGAHVEVECQLVVDSLDDLRAAEDDAERPAHVRQARKWGT